MKLEFLNRQDALIMKIEGEIDHRYATQIRREADRKIVTFPDKPFVIDLTGVTFMDSSGIGVIIGRYKLVTSFGQRVVIASSNLTVNKILDMAGIKKIIRICNSVPEDVHSIL
ncbi:MAG: anti-sigma factor antagonist [Clostridia bacterium]|nr:anti-sigma factor antagonist [Clostridia bacterium]